jgi:type VI secretion system protein ImpG
MASENREELLRAYQRELQYLRQQGAEFAARYPKIAARLDLAGEHCADPHVERLIEAFAFLTGRIQRQLDAEFPQFTSALLQVLYPHFLEPVPSMSIARFVVDVDQGLPLSGYTLPRHARLFAQTDTGATCRFRTAYPVTLWPVDVIDAQLESPERYPFLETHPRARKAVAVLRVRLGTQKVPFSQLSLSRLRFFLNAEGPAAFGLYDLLVGGLLDVVVLPGEKEAPVFAGPSALRPVGLERDEAVLQAPPHALPEYRLLQEYFVFPDKFLFVDIDLPEIRRAGRRADVLLLLSELPGKDVTVGPETFALGCTPIVNLFPKTSEPIRLDQRQAEYQLIADKRDERTTEIHSILKVSAFADPDHPEAIAPFFSFTHPADGEQHQRFYTARRQVAVRGDVPGTDMFLSFVDLHFTPALPPVQTVYAHTLCTNRDLAAQMPAGAALQIEEAAPVGEITCLRKPTRQIEVPLGGRALWLLISQLSLNHLSLSEGEQSLSGFQEILRLYRATAHTSSENQILGITRMGCRPALRSLQRGPESEAWRGFCQGLEVTLEFDETFYVGCSALMMSSVLSRFFGLYAYVNSFTELVVKSSQRQGVWKRWPPMAGEQGLL